MLKCSLKGEALLWLENIGIILLTDEAKCYEQTAAELRKAFPALKDKSALR